MGPQAGSRPLRDASPDGPTVRAEHLETRSQSGSIAPRRAPRPPLELDIGDVLRLRKPHPCGGYEWQVVRLGADIGLRCLLCGRRVLLERATLEKRLKAFVSRKAPQSEEAHG